MPIDLPNRQWPNRQLKKAPIWCSVDLRDGNQALIHPMNLEEKLRFFKRLVEMGFKEIEIGFPSASKLEYDFTRHLIENKLVPDDVTIQVLTQAREELIEKTVEALKGAKRAIIHVYNSTSTVQREIVFKKDRSQILKLAIQGAKWVKEKSAALQKTQITYEYSPESFSATELDFALEVCTHVMEVFKPTKEHPMILNLPATVEMSTPNLYADQIEWMSTHLPNRDRVIISVHTHNDRGCAVAATELALLAGAERVEGTLFGNGERTGNSDLVTLALNFYSQGIHPKLHFNPIDPIIEMYQTCTRLSVHERHPYAGELVYTAFSGSHQDAIAKGMRARDERKSHLWKVPYLPLDPKDVGRDYESIIRLNSQSGKGGAVYLLEREFGYLLPKAMQKEFGQKVQSFLDEHHIELSSTQVMELFSKEYLEQVEPLSLINWQTSFAKGEEKTVLAKILNREVELQIEGQGVGVLDAFLNALKKYLEKSLAIEEYHEHSMGSGSEVSAVCYIHLKVNHKLGFGLGIDPDITTAAMKAIFCALNRLL